jgi:uncharacterized protein YbjT (DUF2867 family)
MPAISASTKPTVLITGANGFIATWLVGDLLKRGYIVRAAVRSEAKASRLLNLYGELHAKDLHIVVIGDIADVSTYLLALL